MEITVRYRRMLDRFRCIDTYKKVMVRGLAFTQGELFYFKKNEFEYLVVGYDKKEKVYTY